MKESVQHFVQNKTQILGQIDCNFEVIKYG